MKFGGTSVANAEAITRSISIVRSRLDEKPIVVVSALSKVTDLLYTISACAEKGDVEGAEASLQQLRLRHEGLVHDLLCASPEQEAEAFDAVDALCTRLDSFVHAVCSLGELSDRSKARIISTGERLSSTVICAAMNASGIPTGFIDARRMMITSDCHLKGEPLCDEICAKAPALIAEAFEGRQAVITQGFVGATVSGETTVLGRGGSDYSASLIGMAVEAEKIEIWTDVDGVRTADPRVVANTRNIARISFEEAAEMAHFGAKVLHPLTIEPAVKKNIPLYVLNSLNPGGEGTAILQNRFIEDGVKSVSFKQNIILMNIFSTKMINTSGFLNKVFEIFSKYRVSVDLISTSEANISLTMEPSSNLDKVVRALSEFSDVAVEDDKAQVSVIGKNIVNLPGMLRRTLSSLDGNVYMISQGATYVNISFVVDRDAMRQTVCDIHRILFEQ